VSKQGNPVLVTTLHRGVFFGYATEISGETISLTDARLCVYWCSDMEGFMGLAAKGPDDKCKIGPRADIDIRNVTSVTKVSTGAVDRWESATWK